MKDHSRHDTDTDSSVNSDIDSSENSGTVPIENIDWGGGVEELYLNTPLDTSKSEIRLLLLDAFSVRSGTFFCEMKSFPLTETGPFTSLSYAWGNPEDCTSIYVNYHDVRVTKTLESALRHIHKANFKEGSKDEFRSGYLAVWADALCIDQSSTIEKSHQVGMMMSIYEKASQVVVWLGEANSRSRTAIGLLKEITTITSDGECTEEALVKSFEESTEKALMRFFEDPSTFGAWDDLLNFITRPWFQRL
jgi:hypothetical protein